MKFVRAVDIESTTNEVVEHFAVAGAKLTVNLLEDSDVLVGGDAGSLEFLANYLLAYVRGDEHLVTLGRVLRATFSSRKNRQRDYTFTCCRADTVTMTNRI